MTTVAGDGRSRSAAVLLLALAGAHVAEAVVLRKRNQMVAIVDRAQDAGSTEADDAAVIGERWRSVRRLGLADGHGLDALVAAAQRHGGTYDLDVIDVVSRALPAHDALALLRQVDPAKLTGDPFASPSGGGRLVAASPDAVRRAAIETDVAGSAVDVRRATRQLQRAAPGRSGIVAAEALAPVELTPGDRWAVLTDKGRVGEPFRRLAPAFLMAEGLHYAVMGIGLVTNPVAGAAAWVSWCAQPLIVFGGAPEGLRPPALLRAALLRPADAVQQWTATVDAAAEARRVDPAGWSAAGQGEPEFVDPPVGVDLFEPRRDDCPWCGGAALRVRLETTDILQHKPGTFTLDECATCGHVFQNPRLSLAGLEYYYADFYHGLGGEMFETFNRTPRDYQQRLDTVTRHTQPRNWLDVGGGAGHFCLHARTALPGVEFDAIDIGSSVLNGERRGWIDQGHHGLLPDLVPELEGRYDVVSLFHCLEHTVDPQAELDAATKVLVPGGHLIIEVPNAEGLGARLLGRWWFPWFQPQHQHFVRYDNLLASLTASGYEIVEASRRVGADLNGIGAVVLWANDKIPARHNPWRRDRGAGVRGAAVLAAAVPAAVLSIVADVASLARRGEVHGSAYRVLARKAGA